MNHHQADKFRHDVIRSAACQGYDDSFYKPLPEDKKYKTYNIIFSKLKELFQKDIISIGKYEQLLLNAFRPDLVYNYEYVKDALND